MFKHFKMKLNDAAIKSHLQDMEDLLQRAKKNYAIKNLPDVMDNMETGVPISKEKILDYLTNDRTGQKIANKMNEHKEIIQTIRDATVNNEIGPGVIPKAIQNEFRTDKPLGIAGLGASAGLGAYGTVEAYKHIDPDGYDDVVKQTERMFESIDYSMITNSLASGLGAMELRKTIKKNR